MSSLTGRITEPIVDGLATIGFFYAPDAVCWEGGLMLFVIYLIDGFGNDENCV